MRTRGLLSVVKVSGDSLRHKGWRTVGVNSDHVYGARGEMFNGMLKKGGWPLTFPTVLGARGSSLLTVRDILGGQRLSAQHTRRTMHTKDVFGDRA